MIKYFNQKLKERRAIIERIEARVYDRINSKMKSEWVRIANERVKISNALAEAEILIGKLKAERSKLNHASEHIARALVIIYSSESMISDYEKDLINERSK